MGNRNKFKSVLTRLLEAEQLLKVGVERGSLSSIERDILLEKLRASYEELLFDKEIKPQGIPSEPTPTYGVEKIEVKRTQENSAPEPKIEVPSVVSSKPVVAETHSSKESIAIEGKEISESKESPKEIIPETKIAKDEVGDISFEFEKSSSSSHKEIESEGKQVDEINKNLPSEIQEKSVDSIVTNSNRDRKVTPTLAEKYQGTKKFRNEVLGSGKKDMASVLKNKPIVDLTKAIGINDKFLFTKELFSGNAELYSNTIKQLNSYTDINDALIYIQENFTWEDKNEAANQLIDLVRRKLLYD